MNTIIIMNLGIKAFREKISKLEEEIKNKEIIIKIDES